MIKLFYSPPWKAFIAPEKPEKGELSPIESVAYEIGMEDYEQAYAEAKANALEVGNWDEIPQLNNLMVVYKLVGNPQYEVLDWPGSAVIKDGKYYLAI